jgi:hypothetical protein
VTNELGKCAITLPGGSFDVIASAASYDGAAVSVEVIDSPVIPLEIVLFPAATDVASEARGAAPLTLSAPLPNPSRGATTFRLTVPKGGDASLILYDASGRRVRTLLAGILTPGPHEVRWDGRSDEGHAVPSGALFARLTTGAEIRTTKLLLTR